MAKQLNVNLAFTADTGKAKQQIQDLQNQLTKFLNQPMSGFGNALTKDIKEASKAAAELKVHLEKATNPDTGTLDFSKLNQSMKQANTSVSQYAAKIKNMGPEGQKSFIMLAQSVADAEVPLRRSNALLGEMWTTMKNTMRWQISSSILHGFMGAISSATGYAKDLNESLNNIRIVTGQSVDQMAKFAENANKAAKALSTTTTEYTNAALIYYQQGLSDKDVLARTDITVKMANVAGESAQKVSDQLTAVWNNFYDGSKSLEYYADVMTALGAATASSTDEISEGLNKFAAVAETVGLSYEYAASALATVTATTRQSADVVGTAFKTLFARVQDLELGKTLDDGTSLGTYSAALATVGVNIKDSNGGLKEMDQILNEMAAKWDTLSKDQQVSLAQTVAGVRQYTQLIALMDNWDFMQENLTTSYSATGTLQEQAEIYEESWQAASERVRAAFEEVYNALINDEAFINLLNNVEKIINGFDTLIDAVGGLKGILSILGVVITNVFSAELSQTIQDIGYNLSNLTEKGRKRVQQEKETALNELLKQIPKPGPTTSDVETTQAEILKSQLESQQKILMSAKELSEEEQAIAQLLLDQQKAQGNIALEKARQLELAKEEKSTAVYEAYQNSATTEQLKEIREAAIAVAEFEYSNKNPDELTPEEISQYQALVEILNNATENNSALEKYAESVKKVAQAGNELDVAKADANRPLTEEDFKKKPVSYASKDDIKAAQERSEALKKEAEAKKEAAAAAKAESEAANKAVGQALQAAKAKKAATQATDDNTSAGAENVNMSNLVTDAKQKAKAATEAETAALEAETAALEAENEAKLKNSQVENNKLITADTITGSLKAVSSLTFALSSLGSAFENIKDPDLSAWEKFSGLAISMSSGLPMLKKGIADLGDITFGSSNKIKLADAGIRGLEAISKKAGESTGIFAKAIGKAASKTGEYAKGASGAGKALAALGPHALVAAAAIGALVLVITQAIKAYNADATAAKNAAKSAEELKNVLNDTKSTYDELKSSIESYQDSRKAIDKLTEGTLEWKQAVQDLNTQVLDLISKYPELAQYVSKVNGQLIIDDSGFDMILDAQLKELSNVASSAYMANIVANEAATKSDYTDTSRSISYWKNEEGSSTWTQTTSQDIQTAVEALNNAEKINLQSREEFGQLMSDAGIVNTDLITALYQNRESLLELSNTIAARDLSEELYKEQVASSYMEGNNNFYNNASSSEKNALEQAVASIVLTDQNIQNTSVGGTKKSRAYDYAESIGWDNVTSVKQKDGKSIFTFEDGSEKAIDQNVITQSLAANQLLKNSQSQIKAFENIITSTPLGAGSKVLEMLTNPEGFDINSLSEEQYNALFTKVEGKIKLDPNQISEEMIKAAGIATSVLDTEFEKWDSNLHEKLMAEQDEANAQSILESAANTYDLDLEVLEIQAKNLRQVNDEAKLTATQAAELAVQNQRLNKGVKELSENWENWSDILNNSDKDTMEYAEATSKLTKVVKELVGATGDFELPDDFFDLKENLDLIDKAAEGDIKAINELGVATASAAIDAMEMSEALKSYYSNLDASVDPIGDNTILENFEINKQKVLEGIQSLQDAVHNGNVAIGDELAQNGEILSNGWVESFNQLIEDTGMGVDEVKSLLSQMGVDAELVTTYKDQEVTVPRWTTYTSQPVASEVMSGYTEQHSYTVQTGEDTFTGRVPVTAIKTGGKSGKTSVKYIGNGKVSPSSVKSSGGGSSKPKTAKPVKKSDTVDRYKEVNDSIEDLQHNLDISNKKADALWGEARFKKMREGVEILKQENKLLEEKANLANVYLAEDAAALKKAAGVAGINFTFNADGNISNYTTEMTKLWTQLDNAIMSANRDGDVSDSEQERIDKLQEKVDAVKDAISQYEDTLKTKQDIDKEYLDNQKEIWDTNFDILTESLEYNLSFNEADLELIDYYLSKMEDNMFKLAEAYTKLNEKSIEYSDNLDIQRKHYEDLTESFKNGEISEAQYKEALLESQSAIVDTLQSLLDLDKEMQEYYGNTLDKAAEEIDIYADKIDHLNSVLDHYNNIMDLAGKSKDYEAMATILEGQAENLHNQLQIAKEEYDMYKTQAEHWKEMMAAVDETDPAFEVYKKNWDAAVIAANEAQDEMLSKTQEWAEAMKAVIENELADIGQTLEKSITGGTSFDELLTSMERANSLQEEYLTDTNKIYETNKLIRTAQQEIDKTTNTVAKNKLKQFINETNQLQEQTKLSEYELKIQQAKYDLIIAEIALEEAQQAKSMVRLTRDSEGNFGYVYTADQNQIDAAQQKLEDAQNNLYNIGLEGANDYSQKYAETMQEMYDTLQEIQTAFLSGEIATQEEYDRRMLEAKEYYFDKLKDFSNLYQVALTTDSRVVNDAWSSDFNDMIYKTEELKSAVNDYADQSAGILKEWADTVKETIDGSGLDDVNKAVSGIVSDSEKLTEVLSGENGLISKLNEEINKVKESTSEYALKRAEIQGLISDYEKLAEQVNADYDDKNITAPETTLPSENAASVRESATGPASKMSLSVGSAVKVKAGAVWYANSYGGGSSGRARNGTILYINESGTHPYNIDGLGWVRKEDLESFKSGGYTGAWGSYGKLALLDEKELILNKGDTSNFLASMEVLERILSIIDLHSANAQLSGVLSAPGFNHMNERSIEQNVHIEASFPGVQDRNEIEEAFNNLINQASQYANRK